MDDGSSWPLLFAMPLASFFHWQSRDSVLLLILVLMLVLAATASAAETALTSVSRIKLRRLEEQGDEKAKRILRLIEQPHIFLSTILAANNIAIIVATTLATLLALDIFANFAEIISTVGLSLIVLIFCEITPKTAAVQAPERWARVLVRPVEWVSYVLKPVVIALTYATGGILRIFGVQNARRGPFLTEEELRLLVEEGGREEVKLEEEKRDMIHNVFELGDTIVREVMVPRIDMITVPSNTSVDQAMRLIVEGGQSRIPMYEGTLDNIVGLLYAKDLLRVAARHERLATVAPLARPVYFVPETKRLDDLLRELRGRRIHMAIVVDEYGAVSGLVTIEDLVEEIVGEIVDEYDIVENLFEQVAPNEYLVDAKISLDDLNDLLDAKLTNEDYDTLGGYVYAHLDKIPTVGDTVTSQGFSFTVLATKGRRVTKVKLIRRTGAEEDEREHDQPTDVTDTSGLTGTSSVATEGPADDREAGTDAGHTGLSGPHTELAGNETTSKPHVEEDSASPQRPGDSSEADQRTRSDERQQSLAPGAARPAQRAHGPRQAPVHRLRGHGATQPRRR
ncbi:MAG TPA: hemolysin family protein [Ktedonobacterales bacterium]|nr:hemolysin family protein [Ktedonobacterales bacterium]